MRGFRFEVCGFRVVRTCLSLFLVFIILNLQPLTANLKPLYAETLSSTDLIEKAKELDGKKVTYKGEAVTAIMDRGEYSWINLNDGLNAIGVWCKSSDMKSVKNVGGYKHKGDILEVEGIFNRACPMHGGELDIHAETLKPMEEGRAVMEEVSRKKLRVSIWIFLATLLILAVFRKKIGG